MRVAESRIKTVLHDLLVLSVPFYDLALIPNTVLDLSTVVNLLLLGLAARGVVNRRAKIPRNFAILTAAVFFLACIMSGFGMLAVCHFSVYGQTAPGKFLKQLIHLSYLSALLAVIVRDYSFPTRIIRSFRIWMGLSALAGVYSMYQFIGNVVFGGALPLLELPVTNSMFGHWAGSGVAGLSLLRSTSFFGEPGSASFFLVPTAIALLYVNVKRIPVFNRRLWLNWVLFLVMVAGELLTLSAAGIASLSIGMILVVLLTMRKTTKRILIASCLLAAAVGISTSVSQPSSDNMAASYLAARFDAITRGNDYSAQDRNNATEVALKLFETYPWVGIGVGDYGLLYPYYGGFRAEDLALRTPENTYAMVLAETGPFGFISFVLLILGTCWLAIRSISQHPDLPYKAVPTAFILMLIGSACYMFAINGFYQYQFWVLLAAVAGIPSCVRAIYLESGAICVS